VEKTGAGETAIAGDKNESGSAVPKNVGGGDVEEKAAERNKASGGGNEPLKKPIGSSGAQEDKKGEEESGPCGLPKKCEIL
jgi:hypothetical protein